MPQVQNRGRVWLFDLDEDDEDDWESESVQHSGRLPITSGGSLLSLQTQGPGTTLSWPHQQFETYVARLKDGYEFGMGPNLRRIKALQEARGVREKYTIQHLKSACAYLGRHMPHNPERSRTCGQLGHDVGKDCPLCTSCHFCRQKSPSPKVTCCQCGERWCGADLANRMGENIDEVKHLPWICPVCRGICNCSVRSCLRSRWNLEMTGQLHSEAYHLGYDSVALYLILNFIKREHWSPTQLQFDFSYAAPGSAYAVAIANRGPLPGIPPQQAELPEKAARRDRGRVRRAMAGLLHSVEAQLPLPSIVELQQDLHEGLNIGMLSSNADDEEEDDVSHFLPKFPWPQPGGFMSDVPAAGGGSNTACAGSSLASPRLHQNDTAGTAGGPVSRLLSPPHPLEVDPSRNLLRTPAKGRVHWPVGGFVSLPWSWHGAGRAPRHRTWQLQSGQGVGMQQQQQQGQGRGQGDGFQALQEEQGAGVQEGGLSGHNGGAMAANGAGSTGSMGASGYAAGTSAASFGAGSVPAGPVPVIDLTRPCVGGDAFGGLGSSAGAGVGMGGGWAASVGADWQQQQQQQPQQQPVPRQQLILQQEVFSGPHGSSAASAASHGSAGGLIGSSLMGATSSTPTPGGAQHAQHTQAEQAQHVQHVQAEQAEQPAMQLGPMGVRLSSWDSAVMDAQAALPFKQPAPGAAMNGAMHHNVGGPPFNDASTHFLAATANGQGLNNPLAAPRSWMGSCLFGERQRGLQRRRQVRAGAVATGVAGQKRGLSDMCAGEGVGRNVHADLGQQGHGPSGPNSAARSAGIDDARRWNEVLGGGAREGVGRGAVLQGIPGNTPTDASRCQAASNSPIATELTYEEPYQEQHLEQQSYSHHHQQQQKQPVLQHLGPQQLGPQQVELVAQGLHGGGQPGKEDTGLFSELLRSAQTIMVAERLARENAACSSEVVRDLELEVATTLQIAKRSVIRIQADMEVASTISGFIQEPHELQDHHLHTESDVRHAVELLLIVADKCMDEDSMELVLEILFCVTPFVSFSSSDAPTRAALIYGGTCMVELLHKRGFRGLLRRACLDFMSRFLDPLVESYKAWGLKTHIDGSLPPNLGYYIGGLRLPALPELPTSSSNNGRGSASVQNVSHGQKLAERFAIIQAAKEADTETLRRTLFKLPVKQLGPSCLYLLRPPLTSLLDPKLTLEASLRHSTVLVACQVLKHASPSWDLSGLNDFEAQQALQKMQEQASAAARAIAEHLMVNLELLVSVVDAPQHALPDSQAGELCVQVSTQGGTPSHRVRALLQIPTVSTVEALRGTDEEKANSMPLLPLGYQWEAQSRRELCEAAYNLLGLAYGIQLWAGVLTWPDIEQLLIVPYTSLNVWAAQNRFHAHRMFVLLTLNSILYHISNRVLLPLAASAATVANSAPASAAREARQGATSVSAELHTTACVPSNQLPAFVLRVWLMSMFEPGSRRTIANFQAQLAQHHQVKDWLNKVCQRALTNPTFVETALCPQLASEWAAASASWPQVQALAANSPTLQQQLQQERNQVAMERMELLQGVGTLFCEDVITDKFGEVRAAAAAAVLLGVRLTPLRSTHITLPELLADLDKFWEQRYQQQRRHAPSMQHVLMWRRATMCVALSILRAVAPGTGVRVSTPLPAVATAAGRSRTPQGNTRESSLDNLMVNCADACQEAGVYLYTACVLRPGEVHEQEVAFEQGLIYSALGLLSSLLATILAHTSQELMKMVKDELTGVTPRANAGLGGRNRVWWCLVRLWGLAVELPVRAHGKSDGGAGAVLRSYVACAFTGLLEAHNQVPAWESAPISTAHIGRGMALDLLLCIIEGPVLAYLSEASKIGAPGGSANWLAHSALLWVQEAFAHPACLTEQALLRLLPPLFYPTICLLLPDQGRPPSPPIVLELLKLWILLLKPLAAAHLLPESPPPPNACVQAPTPYVGQRNPGLSRENFKTALGCTLTGLLSYVLQAVLAVLNSKARELLINPSLQDQDGRARQVLDDITSLGAEMPGAVLPLKPALKQSLCWRLRTMLGTPPQLPADRLPWVMQPLWEGEGGARMSLPVMPTPGDVLFKVADAGFAFLTNLTKARPMGYTWASSVLPALHLVLSHTHSSQAAASVLAPQFNALVDTEAKQRAAAPPPQRAGCHAASRTALGPGWKHFVTQEELRQQQLERERVLRQQQLESERALQQQLEERVREPLVQEEERLRELQGHLDGLKYKTPSQVLELEHSQQEVDLVGVLEKCKEFKKSAQLWVTLTLADPPPHDSDEVELPNQPEVNQEHIRAEILITRPQKYRHCALLEPFLGNGSRPTLCLSRIKALHVKSTNSHRNEHGYPTFKVTSETLIRLA